MTAGGDLASKCKARGGFQRLRDGINELLNSDEGKSAPWYQKESEEPGLEASFL